MKKQWISLAVAVIVTGAVACNSDNSMDSNAADSSTVTTENHADNNNANYTTGSYVNLSSGEPVDLKVEKETRVARPVDESIVVTYYIDPVKWDTIEANTGRIVNGALIHENNTWRVDEYKIKTDDDGSYKEKTPDGKFKIDEDGDVKYKSGDTKIKQDSDGDYKEKSGDTKVKIKDGKTKVKKDK